MMKLRLIYIILFSWFILASFRSEHQIEIYNFQEFESFLNKDTDTTYFVHFWATWCIPCLKELPEIERFSEDYRKHKVSVILVSLDFPGQLENRLIPFIENNKITSRVILLDDPNQNYWINKVNPDWTGAIPATLIYNRGNSVFYEESLTYEEIVSIINEKF